MNMVEKTELSLEGQFAKIAAKAHGPVEVADHGVRFHALLDGVSYKSIAYFVADAVVLHIPLNVDVSSDRSIEIILLLNYLNISIPFGNYELVSESDVSEIRYRVSISADPTLRDQEFQSTMMWAEYFSKRFRSAIETVAAGYADVLSVIEKLEAE
ncbi:hypothetical protein [Variovorax sp. tm]|uniref:hypothetical protein n=1 Tax=Variovorax atrisoli TaxID=3394203 RepID=UPI003A8017A6